MNFSLYTILQLSYSRSKKFLISPKPYTYSDGFGVLSMTVSKVILAIRCSTNHHGTVYVECKDILLISLLDPELANRWLPSESSPHSCYCCCF